MQKEEWMLDRLEELVLEAELERFSKVEAGTPETSQVVRDKPPSETLQMRNEKIDDLGIHIELLRKVKEFLQLPIVIEKIEGLSREDKEKLKEYLSGVLSFMSK